MKKILVVIFIFILLSSFTFVVARSVVGVSDTQGNSRNNEVRSCTKDCSIDKRVDKSVCSSSYKEERTLCRSTYKICKATSKLLRHQNRTEYIFESKLCRTEYKVCRQVARLDKSLCRDQVNQEYYQCKLECKQEKNVCNFNSDCNQSEFCEFDQCADVEGTCVDRPDGCTDHVELVCGCDDVTYSNGCYMAMNNQSLGNVGECIVPVV